MRSFVIGLICLWSIAAQAQGWREAINLPPGPRLFAVTYVNDSVVIAVGDSGRMVISGDYGETWTEQKRYTQKTLYGIAAWHSLVLVACSGELVLRSTNAGVTWDSIVVPYGGFSDVAILDSLHAVVGPTLCSSTDGGTIWQQRTDPNGGSEQGLATIKMLSDSNWLELDYSGSAGIGEMFRTTDAGSSWDNGTQLPYVSFDDMFVSGGLICAVASYRQDSSAILRSRDTGKSWGKKVLLYANGSRLRAIGAYNPNKMLVCGDSGVMFQSTDSGATWQRIPTGLTGLGLLLSVCINSHGKGVAVGGYPRGTAVFGGIQKPAVVVPDPIRRAEAKVYPDPAGRTVRLSVDIPKCTSVRITLLNTAGACQALLYDGELETGHRELAFDISGLARGAYFLRITTAQWSDQISFEKW